MPRSTFSLDPAEFGSHYGSCKLFRFLGKHIVTTIHLYLKIHAEREDRG